MILKIEQFKKDSPQASVILPISKGESSPHFHRLIKELSRQSFQDFEILLASEIEPNGRARNEAVRQAKGNILFLIDETTSLGHERILENLLKPFAKEPQRKIGMTGASILPHQPLKSFQRQYFMMRDFYAPVVKELTPSWKVQHPCMAIPTSVFKEVGGESDCLITGTDNDLRQRVAAAGYEMLLVPETWGYYLPPDSLKEILQKGWRKGKGSAYALLMFPGLFEFGNFFGVCISHPVVALFYTALSALIKVLNPKYWFNPVALLYSCASFLGFIEGWFHWIGSKPFEDRSDLPWRQ